MSRLSIQVVAPAVVLACATVPAVVSGVDPAGRCFVESYPDVDRADTLYLDSLPPSRTEWRDSVGLLRRVFTYPAKSDTISSEEHEHRAEVVFMWQWSGDTVSLFWGNGLTPVEMHLVPADGVYRGQAIFRSDELEVRPGYVGPITDTAVVILKPIRCPRDWPAPPNQRMQLPAPGGLGRRETS